MSIKSFIPGTAERSRKHHIKYLHRKARGHDVLLMVEWSDGKLTELPATLDPEKDGWYEAANGLYFVPAGEGVDPVDYHGVPVVRVHAAIACPISTTAALQAELDEAGEYEVVSDDNGHSKRLVEYEDVDDPRAAADGPDGDGSAADETLFTDGGGKVTRKYNLKPPAPAVGWAFGLDQAVQRAPNAISGNMVRRAVEYGKESVRTERSTLREFVLGAVFLLAVLFVLAVLYIAVQSLTGGGGGGGGSGGKNLALLLAIAGPALRDRLEG